MKEFYFEIGTEEIPAEYFPELLDQIKDKTTELLNRYKLNHSEIEAYGTPRRLVAYSPGIADAQETEVREIVGPSKQAAYDKDGNPTKAAEGFARSKGISVDDLKIKKTDKGEFIALVVEEKGQTTQELLPKILMELIQGLRFPKTMRWSDLDMKFVRPIVSVMLMFDGKPVPSVLNHLKTKAVTRGHMLLAPEPFEVTTFNNYREKLREAWVEIDPETRQKMITGEIENLLAKDGELLLEDPELLKENVYLVEYPRVFRGVFQEHFLELPQPVLISSIRKHQRAFAITDGDGKMVPSFLVVSNIPLDDMMTVRKGYEQVLGARLADAFFFFQEDLKRPISERHDQLSRVVYQKELGSLADKVQRVRQIAGILCEAIDVESDIAESVDRAAQLCKSDLVTEMVQEFPELQGIMGMEYAMRMGEPDDVAGMIRDHYLPRFPGDKLPESAGGAILSLADKLDTIIGGYGLGIIPSGTKDPYGLRRAGRGLVEIIHRRHFSFSMLTVIEKTVGLFGDTFKKSNQVVAQEVFSFVKERLERYMLDNGIRYDTAAAVMATGDDDLQDQANRMEIFETFRNSPDFEPLAIAFKRAGRILTSEATDHVNVEEFVMAEEHELYDAFLKMEDEVIPLLESKDYMQGLQGMAKIRPVLDRFYDTVMVMDENPDLRRNRLSLMKCLSDSFCRFADFTKLVIERTGSNQIENTT